MITGGDRSEIVDRAVRIGFWVWAAITCCCAATSTAMYSSKGTVAFKETLVNGPLSNFSMSLVAVAIVWFCAGCATALLSSRSIRKSWGACVLCTLGVVVLYANVMRERIVYGDVLDYIDAASNLARGEPLHLRYLYPPLFATLLVPAFKADWDILLVLWAANLAGVGLMCLLLTLLLIRYGFDRTVAAMLACAFLAVNVPVLRTLGYVQVNIHVVNCVLFALFCWPQRLVLSALSLALAVHVKASPAVLALPFLLSWNWRWMTWFAVCMAGLALVTVIPYGCGPFVDFYRNLGTIYLANGLQFRENSIDSLIRCSASFLGIPLGAMVKPILLIKCAVLGTAVLAMVRSVRIGAFTSRHDWVLDGTPAMMLFMLLASPLLWEHHPVLVALPYLLMLKRLASPWEWAAYGIAFFLEYHVPTFDFYPWSYGRLLSPVILLVLLCVTSKRPLPGTLWEKLAAGELYVRKPWAWTRSPAPLTQSWHTVERISTGSRLYSRGVRSSARKHRRRHAYLHTTVSRCQRKQ